MLEKVNPLHKGEHHGYQRESFEPDTCPSASPPFARTLVLDFPYAAPCLAILLAVIGGAISFSRRVFLGVAVTSAAAALLAAWTGILLWVLMDLIKGVTG